MAAEGWTPLNDTNALTQTVKPLPLQTFTTTN